MSFCSTRAVGAQPTLLLADPDVSSVALLTYSSGCKAIRKGRARNESRLPAMHPSALSHSHRASPRRSPGGRMERAVSQQCGFSALVQGRLHNVVMNTSLSSFSNPERSSYATARGRWQCIERRRRWRRGASLHPGIHPRAATCISSGYLRDRFTRRTPSLGERKSRKRPKTGPPGVLDPRIRLEPFRFPI